MEYGTYPDKITRRGQDDGRSPLFHLGPKKLLGHFPNEVGIPCSTEGSPTLHRRYQQGSIEAAVKDERECNWPASY